tara:strand:- start:2068 stop:2229 length:162 start_codon:yes stop_codon:yes gene_type:complete
MKYILDRMKEPSSYAAAGAVVVGVGALLGHPVIIIVGIVGGVAGFVLKERGVI